MARQSAGKSVPIPRTDTRELVLDRHFNAIERGELVRRAIEHAFGARAVVATDVDDQGVVELAEVFDGLDDPSDFMIGIGKVSAIDIWSPMRPICWHGQQEAGHDSQRSAAARPPHLEG